MDVASKTRSLFPAHDRIPPEVRLETPLPQDVYQVGDELRRWTGTMQLVDARMRLYREEQFGPVIPVASFTDLEAPIRYLLESDYRRQASIFGRDPDTITQLVDPLVNQVCRVNINGQCQRGPDLFPLLAETTPLKGRSQCQPRCGFS